jgi:hypothetical protein
MPHSSRCATWVPNLKGKRAVLIVIAQEIVNLWLPALLHANGAMPASFR